MNHEVVKKLALTCFLAISTALSLANASPWAQQMYVDVPGPPSPVIIVPGDGGTHMEARLNKTSVVHYVCNKKTTDFFNVWLNLELMVPIVLDCWVDNVRLVYDNVTRRTSNSPGVETRIPDFGNTSSVEWLDPSKTSAGAYFKDIVESLLPLGYQRGVSVRGAPYDFRKAPNECEEYFLQLKTLVEESYAANGDRPSVMIAHSMGGPFSLYFLNRQTQAWKDKYVRSLITLAGVWGGAVKALKVFAAGDNLGIYVLSAVTLRGEQMSSPSLAFLLPSDSFWGPDEVLASTPTRNYTVHDYRDYFDDLGFPIGYEMWLDTKNLVHDLTPPGVEVHCLYGIGVDTEESIAFKSLPSTSPIITYGSGDGTVNVRSLEGCLRWNGRQKQRVYAQSFEGVDHMGIIRHPDVLQYIKNVVAES